MAVTYIWLSSYPMIPKRDRQKFNCRATKACFNGYSTIHKGYKCFCMKTRKIILSRHVKYEEYNFPFPERDGHQWTWIKLHSHHTCSHKSFMHNITGQVKHTSTSYIPWQLSTTEEHDLSPTIHDILEDSLSFSSVRNGKGGLQPLRKGEMLDMLFLQPNMWTSRSKELQ